MMNDDLVSRQAVIDALDGEVTVTGRANAEAVRGYANLICDRIKRLPSAQSEHPMVDIAKVTMAMAKEADLVAVTRCKDCKYCEHWYADKGRCFLWHEDGIDVFGDGFCNYAERRADE